MTNSERRLPNCKSPRLLAGSIALIVSTLVVSHSSFAEPLLITQSRQAISENIPQVAVCKLDTALASPSLAPNERTTAHRLLAEAHISTGQYEQALKALAQISDLTDSAAALLRAHAFAGAGRWSE